MLTDGYGLSSNALQKKKGCYNLDVGCFSILVADLNVIVYHLQASVARRHTNNNSSIHH